MAVADISDEDMPYSVDKLEVRRLAAQGNDMELPDSQKLLVKRLSIEPAPRVGRNPGQYERLLGEEPVRTYVPLSLRPWVMDRTYKDAVNLVEKVTLRMLQRYYWWIGMADSKKWRIRRCYTCQATKAVRKTV